MDLRQYTTRQYVLTALIGVSAGAGLGLLVSSYNTNSSLSDIYLGMSMASYVSTGLAALTLREELRPARRRSSIMVED